jgi:hypothetical protein
LLAVAVTAVIAAGIEWSVIGMALLILIRAARRPQPVSRTTAILLTLLTGILLWANLRESGWEAEWGGRLLRGRTPSPGRCSGVGGRSLRSCFAFSTV